VIKSQANKAGYGKHFMPHFSKLLSDKLRDVDCRKQSTDWKKIGEDKLKAEREKKLGPAARKKAEKPKAVGTASAKNKIDTSACEFILMGTG
jgi:translation initiation factor 3 subunit J